MRNWKIEKLRKPAEDIEVLTSIESSDIKLMLKVFYGTLITGLRKKNRKLIVILITKKAFWAYKMISDDIIDLDKNIEWRSDRYFEKVLDFTEYNDENVQIVIVDDTMNSGNTIRTFYKWLKSHCTNKEITPVVCLMNEEYDFSKTDVDDEDIEFNKNLLIMNKATPEVIGKICVNETTLFHKKLISYIVDLPLIGKYSENGTLTHKIKMPKSEFSKLCKGNSSWTYYKYDYDIIPGVRTNFSFFTFYDYYMQLIFKNLLLNMVVKVQYKEDPKIDEVTVVFTPFALLRSVYCKELERCFDSLFDNTTYKKLLYSQIRKNDSMLETYYNAMYRAIVYVLSCYIGMEFLEYLHADESFTLETDKNDKQFPEVFYENVEKIILPHLKNNDIEGMKLNFYARTMNVGSFTSLNPIGNMQDLSSIGVKVSNYSHEDWFAFLYEKIVLTLRNGSKYITSEELEEAFSQKMDCRSKEEILLPITGVLLEALNKSVLNNYLSYDSNRQILYRGYRSGENTELLLPYDARIFYKGVSCYYKKVGQERYFSQFDFFRSEFKIFLIRIGVINRNITEEQFDFFSRYFGGFNADSLESQIQGKSYLLSYINNNEELLKQIFIRIEEFVDNLFHE